jgi:hypothetical protein
MKFKTIISFIVLVTISIKSFPQTNENKLKFNRANEAYGYLIGQECALNKIETQFPRLSINTINVKRSFNTTFGEAKENIRIFLLEILGEKDFKNYEIKLKNELINTLKSQIYTDDVANNYIAEVDGRAKGQIMSPILETLLSFQFSNRPQDEFLAGFTNYFRTKGHPKSKNTDWQIKVPKSWKASEADRPNIMQKYISDFGSGYQSIMLQINDLPFHENIENTNDALNDFFTEETIKDLFKNEGQFISFKKMTFDGNIGCLLITERTVERLNFKLPMRLASFMFLKGKQMYILQCTVSTTIKKGNIAVEMNKYLPLFMLVANSIVVNDQYK